MASAALSGPGTEHGPCTEACDHRDCAQTRQMAATACPTCSEPIGYSRPFYTVTTARAEKVWRDTGTHLEHALCLETRLETKP